MPPWISCLWNLRELNISKNALLGNVHVFKFQPCINEGAIPTKS